MYDKIYPKSFKKLIRGDSEDPRTINELNNLGLNIIGVTKGKDSKNHGIKWVSDCTIIIDENRCPNIANDFETYEFKKDKDNNIIYEYPDEPDGSAAVRYSLEPYIRDTKWQFYK